MNTECDINGALAAAGLTQLQAARLALELVELSGARRLRGDARLNRCRRLMQLGVELRQQQRLQPREFCLEEAMESYLSARCGRRVRTRSEARSICRRILRAESGLARRQLSSFAPEECAALLRSIFPTLRQQRKGRSILHGVFAQAEAQGRCRGNPLRTVLLPQPEEQEIRPLTPEQIKRLLRVMQKREHRACSAMVAVMLWGGVRPAEAERLRWQDVDWEERVLVLRARHSKTGGCRHIPLRPMLAAWLRAAQQYAREEGGGSPEETTLLRPPNWVRRWRALRVAAGLMPWQQDALRHSFASYHVKRFHDYAGLQEEMGHRSAAQLRTRYLSMRGITAAGAAFFWNSPALRPKGWENC